MIRVFLVLVVLTGCASTPPEPEFQLQACIITGCWLNDSGK